MRRFSGIYPFALTAALALPAVSLFAGAIVHVDTVSLFDPADSSDDTIITRPLQWSEEDQPVQVAVFRILGGLSDRAILPAASNTNQITDPDIMTGIQRAMDRWNSASLSDFEFTAGPLFSDELTVSDPQIAQFLPFGPKDVRLDRFNLITFNDPDIQPAEGVFYIPHVFYMTQDYDPEVDQLAPQAIITELTTGDIGVALDDREDVIEFVIPRRELAAGTILDTDMAMNGTLTDWNQYPEDPEDLPIFLPGTEISDTLGTPDVEAVVTRALGEMAGLGRSHMFTATMTNFYIQPGDANAAFLTNPYEFRTLSLDDEISMGRNYPEAYSTAPGVGGNLYNGSAFDFSNAGVLPENNAGLPQQIIYAGQPHPAGQPFNLDTVFFVNNRFGGHSEADIGAIQLIAHTVSGETQAIPAVRTDEVTDNETPAVNSPALNIDPNGLYDLRGLPAEADVYLFATPQEFTWDDNSERFGAGNVPFEFFGGVLQPGLRFGQGVVDVDDGFINTIRNGYAFASLDVDLVDT
ncbi:hypothetical protein HZA57_01245, partial [Candidatus Poribacteria bacterium]|nr:hypothetical protein [Candidatus Poribacteria bacterium]